MSGRIGKLWRALELRNKKVERQRVAADQNINPGAVSLWLIDFPWPLPGLPYPTLSLDRIRRLRLGPNGCASTDPAHPTIAEASAPCCALAMFAVDEFLFTAQRIGEDQGFKFLMPRIILNKRPHTHVGCAALRASEYLLIFVKGGAMPLWVPNSVLRYSRAGLKHSEKPPIIRSILEKMFPHLTNRCEVFARQRVDGWVGWGNQFPAE